MEVAISASHGPLHCLPSKLEALLLLDESGCMLLKRERKRICLLKRELEELISEFLMEPSDVGYPAWCCAYWVNEVTELAYNIDDCVDILIHERTHGSKVISLWNKLRKKLNPILWFMDEISSFRTRLKMAIQRYKDFHLDQWTLKPGILADEHPLPLLPLDGDAGGLVVGIESSLAMLSGWLVDSEEHRLKVVAIVGTSGIGKTTLAKELYCKLRGQFECRAFVRASWNPDVRRLLTDLLSQVRRHQPVDTYEAFDLVDEIRAHLLYRKYFIIVDGIWPPCTWDIINHAFPDGNHGSRILVTTEVESVAQTCCGFDSKHIFQMGPLTSKASSELFFSRAFNSQCDFLGNPSEALREIIRECGGLPLATITAAGVLASQPDRAEQWKGDCMQSFSGIDWATNPELERMKQVLHKGYNALPHRLKACMLYLCIYKEEYTILKDDLVKLWVAEGFISTSEGKDREEVAGYYFDELIHRGMIQPVHIDHNGEVLSCTVHHTLLSLIRYKSMGDNFVTVLDHSQTDITLSEKVRQLSLHFSNARVTKPPSNMELSHVRTLAFFGQTKCMLSVANFKFLRVMILHLWPDHNRTVYDLSEISKLLLLRVLQISAYHLCVKLPMQMKHLKDLITLEIEGRLSAVPRDIVNLPGLLNLSLPSEMDLPDRIGRMISLRALRHFNLSRNSEENIDSLGELANLQDLHLTCSRVAPHRPKTIMKFLSSILGKLRNLRSLTLDHMSSDTEIMHRDASGHEISCELSSVSFPPALLKKLELLPRICFFSALPKWIGELRMLCILKIEVMGLSSNDIDTLNKLPSLTALSLFVHTAPVGMIFLDKEDFLGLKYLKFMCTTPCLIFLEGAMLNVQRFKLGFNASKMGHYNLVEAGFEHLSGLKEISIKIGDSGTGEYKRKAIESELAATVHKHPWSPVMKIKWVDWIFYGDKEKNIAAQTDAQRNLENQGVLTEEGSGKHGIEDVSMDSTIKEANRRISLPSTPHLEGSGSGSYVATLT